MNSLETTGGVRETVEPAIVFENVSKFYGDVLGINRVTLGLGPGIIGLVGPNGSGKTTLMNLATGLLQPTEGSIRILGESCQHPDRLFDNLGYCTQFDSFPRGMTGHQFIASYLGLHGFSLRRSRELAWEALERVNLTAAGKRKVAGYSKGMRQRVRLAQAMSHRPQVLILDEPLNGLDPMARAEIIDVFQELAAEGCTLVISSHILHEVDMISDRVVLLSSGYVVAEGEISGVRTEMDEHPIQILVRCERAASLASELFAAESVVGIELHEDGRGLLLKTRQADRFYSDLNRLVDELSLEIETVTIADSDVRAVYEYLIGQEGEAR